MKFFPVSVDGFFRNPDKVVEYANSLPKLPDATGSWPGSRSKNLTEINPILNTAILSKIFTCYGDGYAQGNVTWKRSQLYFQEIKRYSHCKDDTTNKGWIHTDINVNDRIKNELVGLIYLSPDIDTDSGTSLFVRNPEMNLQEEEKLFSSVDIKKENNFYKGNAITMKAFLYRNRSMVNIQNFQKRYKEVYEQHEKFYIEKIRFQNIYNSMIAYDPNEHHRANNFYHKEEENRRLTLVFFIGGLEISEYPLKKVKNSEYEKIIDEQIEKKVSENVGSN